MEATQESVAGRPSLEALVESGLLKLDGLHPGGQELTLELIELCHLKGGARVLDVACGAGETACLLAERFAARVHGVDGSERMVLRAQAKARARGLELGLARADAASLPFGDAEFDAVLCECTLCLLDKEHVIREMARVARPGGRVGMHDLCWAEGTPDDLKQTLAEIEGERPETLAGWRQRFAEAGLVEIQVVDRSMVMSRWMQASRRELGLTGQLRLGLQVIRRWGLCGLRTVLQSERVFSSDRLGYGIVVGTKP